MEFICGVVEGAIGEFVVSEKVNDRTDEVADEIVLLEVAELVAGPFWPGLVCPLIAIVSFVFFLQ